MPGPPQALLLLFFHLDYCLDGFSRQMRLPASMSRAFLVILPCPLRGHGPPAEFSAWISAASAETRMRRYNARFAVILPYPLRGHGPPAELSAWIFAVNAKTSMRRQNNRRTVIFPHKTDTLSGSQAPSPPSR